MSETGRKITKQLGSTDLSLALDLARRMNHLVHHVPELGFLVWDDTRGHWRLDKLGGTSRAANAMASDLAAAALAVGTRAEEAAERDPRAQGTLELKEVAALALQQARRASSYQGITAVLRTLKTLEGSTEGGTRFVVPRDLEDFDASPELLTVSNGTVDLTTGELFESDPAELITRGLAVPYDPDAGAPRWTRFLAECHPDRPEVPAFLQRLYGYGLFGHTDEHVFAVHYGKGRNGKSVFAETLKHVTEGHTFTAPFTTFVAGERKAGGPSSDLAAMRGARYVWASEGPKRAELAEAQIKELTGGDSVSARFLHREFSTFKPQALISLVSNYRPTIAGTDDGICERVLLVRWARKFEAHERDPKLAEALRAEAPGILAWLVRGAVEYARDGLQVPACIRRDRDGYRADQDTLDGFYGPDMILARAESGSVPLKEVHEAYFDWAEEEGHAERYRYTLRNLKTELENRGFTFGRTGGRQMIRNARLNRPGTHPSLPVAGV